MAHSYGKASEIDRLWETAGQAERLHIHIKVQIAVQEISCILRAVLFFVQNPPRPYRNIIPFLHYLK